MEIGTVRRVDIEQEMKGAYLDYAMSVITARALPDVRDGLKPVQRRILYAMYDMGLRPNRPYKKSARIVGEVLGKYHPHGDSAVYDAMVRLAQDFTMRYPLVDGQGNFGSIDGDNAAAMRYTEARLAGIAMEMLTDIDKNTVDFVDNFDGTLQEPEVLPARLPNLLLSGASGIAVGMATNIPPHNLREVCDALIYLIDNYDQIDDVTVDDLMQFIKGPDFPTSGTILGTDGIRTAYVTGKGRIIMRAKAHIEEMDGGRHRIIVTELPYQVRKSTLVERIAELVRAGRLDTISDLRDETDRTGIRIVIELKRGAIPRITLNKLLKHTQMQTTFGANMLALVDGEPRVLSLRRMLQAHLEHRQEVIRRRTEYELERARHRAHVLEGLLIALANLDEVIETIKRSESVEAARRNLIRRFELTEIQAQAILDMQLRRLAALEVQKIQDEHADLIKQIAYYEDLLANPHKILQLVRDDLEELRETYGDERRTTITPGDDAADFSAEDLIPREDVLISITRRGYVKRVPASTFRTQRRGGRGVKGMQTREADEVEHLFLSSTLDSVLLFTNQGRVFHQKAHQFPDAGRTARGLPMSNLIPLAHGERVTAAVRVPDFERADYILLATRNGRIKRVDLSAFASVRPSGLIAISLAEGDELRWARLTHGGQEVILTTEKGQAIRFSEEEVRPMGRTAAGVNAIRLAKGDHVASMDIVRPGADLLVVTTRGYGKRTPLSEYAPRGRYGKGVRTISARGLKRVGLIADARVVDADDEITLISAEGIVMRTRVKNIPQMGRATQGAKVMRLDEGDSVVSIARLSTDEDEDSAASED
ncbi:MAG: DNA gyrase subunit A [Chloroflexi bacterium]|nr:MAG: DNA gyrase subunit A [Chloroflexota bacterium]